MEDFPNEVLEEIFSYCTFQDLVWTIPKVNSNWKAVSSSPKIWKNRAYIPSKQDDEENIVSVLKRCPHLQIVDFRKQVVGSKVLEILANNCADLIKLHLHGIQDVSCEVLKNLQSNCPKIEFIDIHDNTLFGPEKLEIIGKFNNLRTISSKWSMYNICLKPIADGCPRLESLETGEVSLDLDDLDYFLTKKKDTLRTLVLPCSLSRESSKCTIPSLSVCTVLESLCIHWNCGNESVLLAQTLGNLKSLKSLIWQDFTMESIDDVFCLLGKKNLAHLVRLEFCSFFSYNDAVTQIIVENCPSLQSFHLGVCEEFTDKTLKMLTLLKDLKELGLYGNGSVTDEGMKQLLCLGHLEYLLLGGLERLTEQTMHLIIQCKCLKVLKFHCQNLRDVPWYKLPEQLLGLKLLEIYRCKDVNVVALKELKMKMPHLKFCVDETSQEWAGYTCNHFE